MSKALESGRTMLDGILAKLPDNLRESVKASLTAPEAADALTLLGDSALARADYSRNMDEIRRQKEELDAQTEQLRADFDRLNTWHEEQKPIRATLEAEIARLKGTPPKKDDPPPVDEKKFLTREEMDLRDRQYAAVMGLGLTLVARHLHDFQEPLDAQQLIEEAAQKRMPLEQYYAQKYADKIAEKRKKDDDAAFDKRYRERRLEEQKLETAQPFPLRNASPSALDVLLPGSQTKPTDFTLDTAVAEYDRLQQTRGQ